MKASKSKVLLSTDGQLSTIAADARRVICSFVQPARFSTEACPAITELSPNESKPRTPGVTSTSVMPLARVTPMCALAGFTAVMATSSGSNSPSSDTSFVARTALISLKPSCVTGSKKPG